MIIRHILALICALPLISGEHLDLSQWLRSPRQLSEGDGVALGLVSALQKWATSLESDSSSLKKDMDKVREANTKLVDEVRLIRSQNSDLKNEVTQANERSMNIKSLYQKMGEQFGEIERENKELKTAFQSQLTVIKAQQDRIENNNDVINKMKTEISTANGNLKKLKGKTETFSVTVTDKFLQLQPIMQNITKNINDLSRNTSKQESEHMESVEKLEKMMTAMDQLHKKESVDMRNDMTQKHKQNVEKCQFITNNLEKKVLDNLEKLNGKDQRLEIETKDAISSLNTGLKSLSRKLDEDRSNIGSLQTFQNDVKTNLDLIKDEINRSVDVLTSAMERNVTESIDGVQKEVRKLEARASSLTSDLSLVKGSVEAMAGQSDKVLGEVNRLKSHTQRSVDTSAGLRTNMIKVEGKINEFETKNLLLLSKLDRLNSTVAEDKEIQINTIKGLERLGDSLASIKVDMMNKNEEEDMKALENKVDSLSVKQLTQEQEITRSTGRINKMELDIRKINNNANSFPGLESKTSADPKLQVEVTQLAETLTTTRNTLAEVLTKIDFLESQGHGGSASRDNGQETSTEEVKSLVNTLKTNVIGLGSYINTINREVNSLATRTRESLETVSQQVVELTADVKGIEDDVVDLKLNGGSSGLTGDKASEDFSSSSLRTDVAGLSTKLYTLKTNVFEINGELTGIKNGLESLNSVVTSVDVSMKTLEDKLTANEKEDAGIKSDLSTLRSGMSGLTNSILTMKSQIKSVSDVDSKIKELSRNVTGVNNDISTTKDAVTKLTPEMSLIASDVSALRSGISRMSRSLQSLADPPRFSCGVTGEEVKVSGVVRYDECGVNKDNMMNLGTGHATVPTDGDYMLTFSANMVSADSQAVWCALYKQSPGDQGWQVLGMINNYQSDAGEEDDRDSGALSVITSLEEGDQVWVEWRGYGDSFLYSNPYKLISFSGYLITSQV